MKQILVTIEGYCIVLHEVHSRNIHIYSSVTLFFYENDTLSKADKDQLLLLQELILFCFEHYFRRDKNLFDVEKLLFPLFFRLVVIVVICSK